MLREDTSPVSTPSAIQSVAASGSPLSKTLAASWVRPVASHGAPACPGMSGSLYSRTGRRDSRSPIRVAPSPALSADRPSTAATASAPHSRSTMRSATAEGLRIASRRPAGMSMVLACQPSSVRARSAIAATSAPAKSGPAKPCQVDRVRSCDLTVSSSRAAGWSKRRAAPADVASQVLVRASSR